MGSQKKRRSPAAPAPVTARPPAGKPPQRPAAASHSLATTESAHAESARKHSSSGKSAVGTSAAAAAAAAATAVTETTAPYLIPTSHRLPDEKSGSPATATPTATAATAIATVELAPRAPAALAPPSAQQEAEFPGSPPLVVPSGPVSPLSPLPVNPPSIFIPPRELAQRAAAAYPGGSTGGGAVSGGADGAVVAQRRREQARGPPEPTLAQTSSLPASIVHWPFATHMPAMSPGFTHLPKSHTDGGGGGGAAFVSPGTEDARKGRIRSEDWGELVSPAGRGGEGQGAPRKAPGAAERAGASGGGGGGGTGASGESEHMQVTRVLSGDGNPIPLSTVPWQRTQFFPLKPSTHPTSSSASSSCSSSGGCGFGGGGSDYSPSYGYSSSASIDSGSLHSYPEAPPFSTLPHHHQQQQQGVGLSLWEQWQVMGSWGRKEAGSCTHAGAAVTVVPAPASASAYAPPPPPPAAAGSADGDADSVPDSSFSLGPLSSVALSPAGGGGGEEKSVEVGRNASNPGGVKDGGGVRRRKQQQPTWAVSLLAAPCHVHPCLCLEACFCPCVTVGRLSHALDPSSASTPAAGALLYSLLSCFLSCHIYSAVLRGRVRERHGLPDAPLGHAEDCFTHCCCNSCALMQEMTEMQLNGDIPGGKIAPAPARPGDKDVKGAVALRAPAVVTM